MEMVGYKTSLFKILTLKNMMLFLTKVKNVSSTLKKFIFRNIVVENYKNSLQSCKVYESFTFKVEFQTLRGLHIDLAVNFINNW